MSRAVVRMELRGLFAPHTPEFGSLKERTETEIDNILLPVPKIKNLMTAPQLKEHRGLSTLTKYH